MNVWDHSRLCAAADAVWLAEQVAAQPRRDQVRLRHMRIWDGRGAATFGLVPKSRAALSRNKGGKPRLTPNPGSYAETIVIMLLESVVPVSRETIKVMLGKTAITNSTYDLEKRGIIQSSGGCRDRFFTMTPEGRAANQHLMNADTGKMPALPSNS